MNLFGSLACLYLNYRFQATDIKYNNISDAQQSLCVLWLMGSDFSSVEVTTDQIYNKPICKKTDNLFQQLNEKHLLSTRRAKKKNPWEDIESSYVDYGTEFKRSGLQFHMWWLMIQYVFICPPTGNRRTFVHLGYRIEKLKDPGIHLLLNVSYLTVVKMKVVYITILLLYYINHTAIKFYAHQRFLLSRTESEVRWGHISDAFYILIFHDCAFKPERLHQIPARFHINADSSIWTTVSP